MTHIILFAGMDSTRPVQHGNGDQSILLACEMDYGRKWCMAAAISYARALVKAEGLTDVGIGCAGKFLWADATATERLYPHTGAPPAPVRHGGPGNVFAQSAVICPWDKTRHKLIPFA